MPQCADGSLKVRSVGNVKSESIVAQQMACGGSLFMAFLRERAVIPMTRGTFQIIMTTFKLYFINPAAPASEFIFLIPSGLPVADQHQGVLGLSASRDGEDGPFPSSAQHFP